MTVEQLIAQLAEHPGHHVVVVDGAGAQHVEAGLWGNNPAVVIA